MQNTTNQMVLFTSEKFPVLIGQGGTSYKGCTNGINIFCIY